MSNPTARVSSFEIAGPYTLRVQFDDATEQTINFIDVLAGELYGPLRDLPLFNQVRVDPEVHTLIWPSSGSHSTPLSVDSRKRQRMKRNARKWNSQVGLGVAGWMLRWDIKAIS